MMKRNCLMIEESSLLALPLVEELSDEAASIISGGRFKKPLSQNTRPGLMSADGEPVSVYVDGVLVNSVTTGYYPR